MIELVLAGVVVQLFALALLALLGMGDDEGKVLLARLRSDGRPEHAPDPDAVARRRQIIRALLGVFLGGTVLALVGLVR